jgi:sRNA-binding carbon storage regulator CsrA
MSLMYRRKHNQRIKIGDCTITIGEIEKRAVMLRIDNPSKLPIVAMDAEPRKHDESTARRRFFPEPKKEPPKPPIAGTMNDHLRRRTPPGGGTQRAG